MKSKTQKEAFNWLMDMQVGGWSFSCRWTNRRRGRGLTVPWQMVRKPFFTEHFLFCHTFLSLRTRHESLTHY